MVVETRAPRHIYRLVPCERSAVPPKMAYYVHGAADGPCKFHWQGRWCVRLRAGRRVSLVAPASSTIVQAGGGRQPVTVT